MGYGVSLSRSICFRTFVGGESTTGVSDSRGDIEEPYTFGEVQLVYLILSIFIYLCSSMPGSMDVCVGVYCLRLMDVCMHACMYVRIFTHTRT